MDRLTAVELQQEDWRVVDGDACAWFEAPSHAAGAALVARIAELPDGGGQAGGSRIAERADGNGMPDVDLRASGVRIRIRAVSSSGLSADVAQAQAISAAARELGLVPDPAVLQSVRVAIDAVDKASVRSFWRTVLGYEPLGTDGLGDPQRRDPAISFHPQDPPRPLRNRLHVDVVRPPAAVEAAKAAIGREAYGAYQLTVADDEGNEVDLVPGGQLSEDSDWHTLFGAMTFYPTTSPVQASHLATAVAELADDLGVPMLVDLRPDGVTIDGGKDQWEDSEGQPEPRFVELAGRIQAAARDLALVPDPTNLRFVQFGIDALDVPAVRAFWTTLLGYQHDPRTELTDIYDPRRLNPVLFFQQLDGADEGRRRQRNRIHLAVCVPSDQAQACVDAALATGGRVVNDTTLADPEGNEVILSTQP
ncbi:hypothetical protein EV646_104171 [Kribbella antiqua]|uniref:Glyoxalase-like domain-containing protein n=1 Tax=Kribbella antiqua TaxID=2512217 RepID=A0A4R2ISQ6_9ACTN|nr:VOC family protein [Kribbella antiqua]TCO48354.1 hypothetical protein EV646_104171 [Kribbella antiqua]